jgi:hypothetical protein
VSLSFAIAVCSLVATAAGFAVGLIRFGMAIAELRAEISAAERRAKHDAINAVSAKVSILEERKLSADVYRAELAALQLQPDAADRRLDALERRTGLDGSGPHHDR